MADSKQEVYVGDVVTEAGKNYENSWKYNCNFRRGSIWQIQSRGRSVYEEYYVYQCHIDQLGSLVWPQI